MQKPRNPIRAEPTWRIAPTSSLPPETGFTLRAYRQHEDSVDFGDVAIQRHIPMRPATDHQFPLSAVGRATDQGVRFKHADGLDDLVYPRSRIVDQILIEVIENPVEILPNLGRQLDAGHRYFVSLRTDGGFAALPATRPSR